MGSNNRLLGLPWRGNWSKYPVSFKIWKSFLFSQYLRSIGTASDDPSLSDLITHPRTFLENLDESRFSHLFTREALVECRIFCFKGKQGGQRKSYMEYDHPKH